MRLFQRYENLRFEIIIKEKATHKTIRYCYLYSGNNRWLTANNNIALHIIDINGKNKNSQLSY